MIFVDAGGLFSGMFNKNFQETIIIPVHVVAMGNQKAIINKGFRSYLNKAHNIDTADKLHLCQWFQRVFFHCMLGMQDQ